MENEKSPLYIPMGLKEEPEFFPGFGKPEMFKTIAAVVLFAAADAAVFVLTRSVEAAIILLLLGIAISIGLFIKDGANTSIADKIADVLRFSKSRKSYPCVMKDEWGDE